VVKKQHAWKLVTELLHNIYTLFARANCCTGSSQPPKKPTKQFVTSLPSLFHFTGKKHAQ